MASSGGRGKQSIRLDRAIDRRTRIPDKNIRRKALRPITRFGFRVAEISGSHRHRRQPRSVYRMFRSRVKILRRAIPPIRPKYTSRRLVSRTVPHERRRSVSDEQIRQTSFLLGQIHQQIECSALDRNVHAETGFRSQQNQIRLNRESTRDPLRCRMLPSPLNSCGYRFKKPEDSTPPTPFRRSTSDFADRVPSPNECNDERFSNDCSTDRHSRIQ